MFLTALLFPVFVVPIVFLRCWTSQIILGKWHLDDTLAVASLMFALGQSVMHCIREYARYNVHVSSKHVPRITAWWRRSHLDCQPGRPVALAESQDTLPDPLAQRLS